MTLTIEESDSLSEIMKKIDVVEDLSDSIFELGAGPLADIFSRFLDTSEQEFERFIDRLIGLHHNEFKIASRIVLLKACSTVFPHPYALEAAFAIIYNTKPFKIAPLKQGLDGNRCVGFFSLYTLVYSMFDVKIELNFLKKYPKLFPTKEGKINLMNETIQFFNNAPGFSFQELRMISFVNDVIITEKDTRFKQGKYYPGVLTLLKQFTKTNQTDIVFMEQKYSSRFKKSINKKVNNVQLEYKSKTESADTILSKYMDLYPGSKFILLTSDSENLTKLNLAMDKIKRIDKIFALRMEALCVVEQPTPREEGKQKGKSHRKSKALGKSLIGRARSKYIDN